MMRLSLPILFCLSVLLEKIVCLEILNFGIENFGVAEIYSHVWFEGNNRRGLFVLKKSPHDTADSGRQRIVRLLDIVHDNFKQDASCTKVVSFYVNGKPGNYKIKFSSHKTAGLFVQNKALPPHFKILWARIYSRERPVIVAYDYLDRGADMGFKVLDQGEYPDMRDRFNRMPNLFKRSDLRIEIRTSFSNTLFLRNKTYTEDYMMKFHSKENLDTFLEFFPGKVYDDFKTQRYYYGPRAQNTNTSRSRASTSHDLSESQDTTESYETSE